MKKLVFFPSDAIEDYIKKGRTYDFLDSYYNPGEYFDEVYCLSPWGNEKEITIGKIHYIKEHPNKFYKWIKKIKPDIVRGYGGYWCADWISMNKVKNIPTIVSVHDTNPNLIYDSLKYADGIICMSNAVKNAVLNKIKFDSERIWVMPNRLDVNLFSKKYDKEYFEKLDQKYGQGKHILHVGRKDKQKNLETVIKALSYLSPEYKCIFIGQGDTVLYKELAKEYKVGENCFFVESVPNDEMPLWYSWCDCMCTPSRWEGFGYVFMEAASCETAIVTSNIAPMNEYLDDSNAILVDDYENPQQIAEAIYRAVSNSEEIAQMKKNARNVGLKFEKNHIDQQEISIYKKVISGRVNNKKNMDIHKIFEYRHWK